jgi:hypothetical protein
MRWLHEVGTTAEVGRNLIVVIAIPGAILVGDDRPSRRRLRDGIRS